MSLRVQPDPESKVHSSKRHSESLRQKNTCAEISSVSTKKKSKHYQSVLSGNLMLYDANDWTEKQFDRTIMTIHIPTVHIWFILWWSNSTFLYISSGSQLTKHVSLQFFALPGAENAAAWRPDLSGEKTFCRTWHSSVLHFQRGLPEMLPKMVAQLDKCV